MCFLHYQEPQLETNYDSVARGDVPTYWATSHKDCAVLQCSATVIHCLQISRNAVPEVV
jgi:hypothetical protein